MINLVSLCITCLCFVIVSMLFGNFQLLVTLEIRRCAVCLCTNIYSFFAKIMERIVHNTCMNYWRKLNLVNLLVLTDLKASQ